MAGVRSRHTVWISASRSLEEKARTEAALLAAARLITEEFVRFPGIQIESDLCVSPSGESYSALHVTLHCVPLLSKTINLEQRFLAFMLFLFGFKIGEQLNRAEAEVISAYPERMQRASLILRVTAPGCEPAIARFAAMLPAEYKGDLLTVEHYPSICCLLGGQLGSLAAQIQQIALFDPEVIAVLEGEPALPERKLLIHPLSTRRGERGECDHLSGDGGTA